MNRPTRLAVTLIIFGLLALPCLAKPTEVSEAVKILTDRLESKAYTADDEVKKALATLSEQGNADDWLLWQRCTLFYDPAHIELNNSPRARNDWDVLEAAHPVLQFSHEARPMNKYNYRTQLALGCLKIFTATDDVFVKLQMASFFHIMFSPANRETLDAVQQEVDQGRLSQEQTDEFLATAAFVRISALTLKPETYGKIYFQRLQSMARERRPPAWLIPYVEKPLTEEERGEPLPAQETQGAVLRSPTSSSEGNGIKPKATPDSLSLLSWWWTVVIPLVAGGGLFLAPGHKAETMNPFFKILKAVSLGRRLWGRWKARCYSKKTRGHECRTDRS